MNNILSKEYIVKSGTIHTVPCLEPIQLIKLTDTSALGADTGLTWDGNENLGQYIIVENFSTPTVGAGHLMLFGNQVPDELANKRFIAFCFPVVVNTTWYVYILPSFDNGVKMIEGNHLVDASVLTAAIALKAITFALMADLNMGHVIIGDAGNRPAAVDATTIGYLLGGTGTDCLSMEVDAATGDIACTSIGGKILFAIPANKVTETMIRAAAISDGLTGGGGAVIKVKPDVINGTSIVVSSDGVRLDNDATAPGNDYFYGTNSAGVKGWYPKTGTVLETTLSIPTAQVLTLNATPLQIIAAPGAGYAIEVETAIMELTYNSAAYATYTNLQVITDTADMSQFYGAFYLAATKTVRVKLTAQGITDKTQIIENKAVFVSVAAGDPTAGDSDIKVYVKYRIIAV
jgi:hypothetical protein